MKKSNKKAVKEAPKVELLKLKEVKRKKEVKTRKKVETKRKQEIKRKSDYCLYYSFIYH